MYSIIKEVEMGKGEYGKREGIGDYHCRIRGGIIRGALIHPQETRKRINSV